MKYADRVSRRRFMKLAAGFAGTAALAACAPAAAPSAGPAPAAGEEEAQAPVAEQVTLSFGHTWSADFQPRQNEFDEQYMENHPEVSIEVSYNTWADHNRIVPTWAAAGTMPDVVYVHGRYALPWNFEGVLIPLDAYIDGSPEFNIEGVWPEALRLYQHNGAQYEIPYDHGPVLLGYNKDMFDEAGHAYPDETWTMDDFRAAAIALSDPENRKWGWEGDFPNFGNESNPCMLGGWGLEAFNEDDTMLLIDSPEAIQTMQWWVDLIHVDNSGPTPAESQAFEQGPWISGTIAMSPVPSWETPGLARFASFAWDVAPWPAGPVQRQSGSFGSGFGITRDSQNPDPGWTYLSEYLSKEGMEFMWGSTGRGSPARKEAYDSWINSPDAPEHASFYLEALDTYAITGHPYRTLAGGEIMDILQRERDLMRSGEKSVEDAVAAIMEEGTPVLEAAAERMAAAS